MILAGDIGGTKTLLRLTRDGAVVAERSYPSAQYPGLEALIQAFLQDTATPCTDIHNACFAVAGPVTTEGETEHRARITNLPWEITTRGLCDLLRAARVQLVNDFYAVGHGIACLGPDDLAPLQTGAPRPHAPRLALGAGTGLGVAQLIWMGHGHDVLASEGGHTHYAPTDALQTELLGWLRDRYGRVSNERLVSGPGLANIYAFLHAHHGGDPAQLDAALTGVDPAARITALARSGTDPLAEQGLSLFVRIYGAVAGDLALVTLATGGVYLAGGIAAKILPEIQAGGLLHAFNDKARMSPLVQSMPLYVVLNSKVGLLGAARLAAAL